MFDFQFPIFDESYRSVIETKILRHYYTREIGLETVGLWKLKLNTKLNEIMPYYNKLYKSELIEFNPLYDVELTRERKVEGSGTKNTKNSENRDGNGRTENTQNNNANVREMVVIGTQQQIWQKAHKIRKQEKTGLICILIHHKGLLQTYKLVNT